ncbi:MAG: cytochrome b5-like heme/steroid binding domain-containing protein [Microgenomates group bacterium]
MVLLTLGLVMGTYLLAKQLPFFQKAPTVVDQNLKPMTLSELSKHDGSDPKLPIYLAYEGNVYDVTSGKKFYEKGAVYNFLAGKDSTTDLNIAGGAIIRRKYPIVARLVK